MPVVSQDRFYCIVISRQPPYIFFPYFSASSPTPRVSWKRLGGGALPDHVEQRDFGKEIYIRRTKIEDEGRYRCEGRVDGGNVVTKDFMLRVECKETDAIRSKIRSNIQKNVQCLN